MKKASLNSMIFVDGFLDASFCHAAVNGDALANNGALTYLKYRVLTFIGEGRRIFTHCGELVDLNAAADVAWASDHHMGFQNHIIAQHHSWPDDAVGPYSAAPSRAAPSGWRPWAGRGAQTSNASKLVRPND